MEKCWKLISFYMNNIWLFNLNSNEFVLMVISITVPLNRMEPIGYI